MAIRDPVDDLYAALGVAGTATRDEITAAFRARARELHPDANPETAREAEERFKRVSMAYGVLSDPTRRARYDAGRRGGAALVGTAAAPSAPAVPTPGTVRVAGSGPATPGTRLHLSRRGARWAVGSGVALMLLGFAAAGWVISLQRHDAELRARGVAAVATVVDVDGRRLLEFTTRDGRSVRAAERAKSGEAQPAVGARVAIHYDRDHPTTVVTDESHTGRDVTLWIVTVKLVVGGGVLGALGLRRLRREEPVTAG